MHNLPNKSHLPIKQDNQRSYQFNARTVNEPNKFNYGTKYQTPLQNSFYQSPTKQFGDINRPIPQRNIPLTNNQVFNQPSQMRPSTSSQNFKPTPMSTQTSNSVRPYSRQFTSNGKPNFLFKELHNTEVTPELSIQENEDFCNDPQSDEQEYYEEYPPDYQEENFQTQASDPPPLI